MRVNVAVSVVSALTAAMWLRAPALLHAVNANGLPPIAWVPCAPMPLTDPTITWRVNGATVDSGRA